MIIMADIHTHTAMISMYSFETNQDHHKFWFNFVLEEQKRFRLIANEKESTREKYSFGAGK